MLALLPSEHLSVSEIAAAAVANQGGVFNPQQHFRVDWPDEPVVARAYIDQLERSKALPEPIVDELAALLERAESQLPKGARDIALVAKS